MLWYIFNDECWLFLAIFLRLVLAIIGLSWSTFVHGMFVCKVSMLLLLSKAPFPCPSVSLVASALTIIQLSLMSQVASVWEEEEEDHHSHEASWRQEGWNEACSAESQERHPARPCRWRGQSPAESAFWGFWLGQGITRLWEGRFLNFWWEVWNKNSFYRL